jgi:hypothetical protein
MALRASVGNIPGMDREALVTYVVIELLSCWSSFSRYLFLSTAMGALDGQETPINLGVPQSTSVDAAMTHAIARNKPWVVTKKGPPWTWSDEPSWARTSVLLNSLDAIGSSNRPKVVAGLAFQTNVFAHLPDFRNFFAHKNEDTARKLPAYTAVYLIPANLRAAEVLLRHAGDPSGTPRPQALILDWVDDVTTAVTLVI